MSYTDLGFNKYLTKAEVSTEAVKELDALQVDQLISQLSGTKITDYTSKNFNFIPTLPLANPKKGDVYFDEINSKLKVYTGSAYENITSS